VTFEFDLHTPVKFYWNPLRFAGGVIREKPILNKYTLCCHASDTNSVRVTRSSCDADALNHFDGGHRTVVGVNGTAGIFVTFPQPYLSTLGGFVDQVGLLATS